MNAARRRIVITGYGAVTPLGTGNEALWQALQAGKSGVREVRAFTANGIPAKLAAEVFDFDPKRFVKPNQRRALRIMARDIQLAVGAAQLAVDDADWESSPPNPTRFGVNCGAGLIVTELEELAPSVALSTPYQNFDMKIWGEKVIGQSELYPLWMLKYLPNMPACHISIIHDAQGPNNSITVGEASATMAIGEAFRILERGDADAFLVGGTDSKVNPLSFTRLILLERIATRFQEQPERAVRPFDAERDGTAPGEGSAFLTLETLEHARNRGGKPVAEVIGFGSACVPHRKAAAVEQALQRALRDAQLEMADLGFIVAHGEAVRNDDQHEAEGLATALGTQADQIPIVCWKGYFGHLGAGTGAVELVTALLCQKEGELLRSLNCDQPDPTLPPLCWLRTNIDFPKKPYLLYDLSLSGHCAALIVKPFDAEI